MLTQASQLSRLANANQPAGAPLPPWLFYLPLLVFAFVVWQTVGLARLKRFNRWFAVVFFAWWAVALVWNATVALRSPTVKLLPATAFFSVLIGLNLSSAWYLSRRTFREFAVQFVAERAKEKQSRSTEA
jgi:hypothetical protein